MPDWVSHLLLGAGTAKALRRQNLRVVMLGALVPDAAAVIGTLSDLGWLPFDTFRMIVFMLPLGSPLAIALICLAVAFWMSKPWRAFGLLALGAATHVAADVMQVGHVHMLAYPFRLDVYNWHVHALDESGHALVGLAALAVLLVLRAFAGARDIRLDGRRGWLSVLPLAALAGTLWWNMPRIEEENILNLRFLSGREAGPGEKVMLVSSRVVGRDPLVVRKLRREVEVEWPGELGTGTLVSVWGTYRDGRVVAERLVMHATGRKIVLSLVGALVFLLYWVRIPWLDGPRAAAARAAR